MRILVPTDFGAVWVSDASLAPGTASPAAAIVPDPLPIPPPEPVAVPLPFERTKGTSVTLSGLDGVTVAGFISTSGGCDFGGLTRAFGVPWRRKEEIKRSAASLFS